MWLDWIYSFSQVLVLFWQTLPHQYLTNALKDFNLFSYILEAEDRERDKSVLWNLSSSIV